MKLSIKLLAVFFCVFSIERSLYGQQYSNTADQRYDRSALSIVLLDVADRKYATEIRNSFLKQPMPEKYDDHSIPLRYIPVDENPANEQNIGFRLEKYLNESGAGKMMLAKWFNRDEQGNMSMDLISTRGKYNATDLDVKSALASKTGMSKIQDAGENLIKKSYIAVYSFKIVDKEAPAKAAGAGLKVAGSLLDAFGYGSLADIANVAGTVVENVRGFTCFIDVHLFQLDWNEQVANNFYTEYWISDGADLDRTDKFENSNIFNVKYISTSSKTSDVTGITIDGKENEQRIDDLMRKTLPQGLAALEGGRTVGAAIPQEQAQAVLALSSMYQGQQGAMSQGLSQFMVKSKVYATKPIKADIGLKEGLEKNDLYLVYERQVGGPETMNTADPKPIAAVRVKGNHIWNNLNDANGKADGADLTQFYQIYGKKLYPGLLLQQKKQDKNYISFYGGALTRTFIMGLNWEIGHRFKVGFGGNYILDDFYEQYEFPGLGFGKISYKPTSFVGYLSLAQYVNLGSGLYFEPMANIGYIYSQSKIKYFATPDQSSNYADITDLLGDTYLKNVVGQNIYLEGGVRFGITVSPTGSSLFVQATYSPNFSYSHISQERKFAEESPYTMTRGGTIPVNIAIGFRLKN